VNCRHCGAPFEPNASGTRIYCSTRCRVASHRLRTDAKNATAPVELVDAPVSLSAREQFALDGIALGLESEMVEMIVDGEIADAELVDQGLRSGRAAWRYEDSTLQALETLQSDPWFDFE